MFLAVSAIGIGVARAAFSSSTSTTGNTVTALTVAPPANLRCLAGGLLNSFIAWNATSVAGAPAVSYRVTRPDAVVVDLSATQYQLPTVTLGLLLGGTYTVRTRVAAWGWLSAPSSIYVLASIGGVIVCT